MSAHTIKFYTLQLLIKFSNSQRNIFCQVSILLFLIVIKLTGCKLLKNTRVLSSLPTNGVAVWIKEYVGITDGTVQVGAYGIHLA